MRKSNRIRGITVIKKLMKRENIEQVFYRAQIRYKDIPITLCITKDLEEAIGIYCAAVILTVDRKPTKQNFKDAKKAIDHHVQRAK